MRRPPSSPAPLAGSGDASASGDPGIGALIVFVAAVVIVVAAGAVGQWWVLVPVMLADFAATFGVIATMNRSWVTMASRAPVTPHPARGSRPAH